MHSDEGEVWECVIPVENRHTVLLGGGERERDLCK